MLDRAQATKLADERAASALERAAKARELAADARLHAAGDAANGDSKWEKIHISEADLHERAAACQDQTAELQRLRAKYLRAGSA